MSGEHVRYQHTYVNVFNKRRVLSGDNTESGTFDGLRGVWERDGFDQLELIDVTEVLWRKMLTFAYILNSFIKYY